MSNKVYHRRQTDEWYTPMDLYLRLHEGPLPWRMDGYGFQLDAAATDDNHLCDRWITAEQDALQTEWNADVVWLNPPYSRLKQFMRRAAQQSKQHGSTILCLIPSRTDTKAFHEIIVPEAHRVIFLKGRLKFGGCPDAAPFPSCLVEFSPGRPFNGPEVLWVDLRNG